LLGDQTQVVPINLLRNQESSIKEWAEYNGICCQSVEKVTTKVLYGTHEQRGQNLKNKRLFDLRINATYLVIAAMSETAVPMAVEALGSSELANVVLTNLPPELYKLIFSLLNLQQIVR